MWSAVITSAIQNGTILILAFGFVWRFGKNVSDLLDRIKSAKIGQNQIDFDSQGQKDPKELERAAPTIQTRDPATLEAIEEEKRRLLEVLITLKRVRREEPEPVLLTELATMSLMLGAERLYRNIFGTQLHVLSALNSTAEGIAVSRIEQQFNQWRTEGKTASASFQAWLGFLKAWNTVSEEGGVLRITKAGHSFLLYLVEEGIPLVKPN